MFEDYKVFKTELGGRPLVVETGKMAMLAAGSCLIRYGETEVLCTATISDQPREGVDFFPLSVDYEEKLYAVGKIPGSFQRREGKASEKAILASRVIDRPIRPLFPKDMRNDVSVVATVMSVDPDCSPEITAMIGVSIALSISPIPWDGPISGVSVGLVDGEFVINPTAEQKEKSEMAVTVASTDSLVAMIEAGGNEISDEDMFDGIMFGHKENQKIVEFIKGIQKEIGKEKIPFESNDPSPEMFEDVKATAEADVMKALDTDDKRVRDAALLPIYERVHAELDEKYPDETEKIDDGNVHPRTDSGSHCCDARNSERRSASRRTRRRGFKEIYPPLQYAFILRRRDKAFERSRQKGNRTRRSRRKSFAAGNSFRRGLPIHDKTCIRSSDV